MTPIDTFDTDKTTNCEVWENMDWEVDFFVDKISVRINRVPLTLTAKKEVSLLIRKFTDWTGKMFGGKKFHSVDALGTAMRSNRIVLDKRSSTMYFRNAKIWRVSLDGLTLNCYPQ